MIFLEKVKYKLLRQKQASIDSINIKIGELESQLGGKEEEVSNKSDEKDEAQERKSEIASKTLKSKELKDLQILYNFLSNYSKIIEIIDLVSQMNSISEEELMIFEGEPLNGVIRQARIAHRAKITEKIKKLNDEILEIYGENPEEEQEKKEMVVPKENSKPQGFLNIFFKKIFAIDDTDISQSSQEENESQSRMEGYQKAIARFRMYWNRFLEMDADFDLTKTNCSKMVHTLSSIHRFGALTRDDEEYVLDMGPIEFWKELLRYYNIIEPVKIIIDTFYSRFAKFAQLSETSPELFDLNVLGKIIKENGIKYIDLKNSRKILMNIEKELTQTRGDARDIKTELAVLRKKREGLSREIQRIKKASTINELGYKTRQDAAKSLDIELKEYIVIPVPRSISTFSELFNSEKRVKIKCTDRTFSVAYSNDVSYGKINSMENDENVDMVLLVPIDSIRKEDVDSVKSGLIGLNSSIINLKSIIAIKPESRAFDFGKGKVKTITPEQGSIFESVKSFLGDDFVLDYKKEIGNYDFLKKIPEMSSKEKRLRRQAIKIGLVENFSGDYSKGISVLVNDKPYYLNYDDEKDMAHINKSQEMDEVKLAEISERIQSFLMDNSSSSFKIDCFYRELLDEYFRINPKARAEYYDEDNTTISINGVKYSIKPTLSPKKEEVAERYTRDGESKAYKLMKLANIVNRFAHLAENEELEDTLFQVKSDLIEAIIEIAKRNPSINIRQRFDENKMVRSIVTEIPGYDTIALHVKDASSRLICMLNSLEYTKKEVVPTTIIQYPGVNLDLLSTMKKLPNEKRIESILKMDDKSFYKLMIRMGYDSEYIQSVGDKSAIVKEAVSDDRMDKLIEESKEVDGDYSL